MTNATVSLAAGDGDACNDLWNFPVFGDRLLTGIPMTAKERQDFLAGLRSSFNWGDTIIKNLGDSGDYAFLRAYRRDGTLHALFRMVNADGTLNYHDVEFAGDGAEVQAVDAFVYVSAENLSETMRTLIAASYTQRDDLTLPGFSREDGLSAYRKLHQKMQQGDFAGVLSAFSELPKDVRSAKAILILRLQAAQQLGDDEHQTAIQDLITAFPKNPILDFVLIDAHHMKKEWDLGLACIDRLEKTVGGDPYLDSIRASMLMEADRLPEARAKAESAVLAVPDIRQGWWMLITTMLRQKDHRSTADTLNRMRDRFKITFDDLTDIDGFENFVASQEYAAWRKAQEATPAPP